MNTLKIMGRARVYYARGHGTIGIAFSLVNTLGIWFGLVPGINDMFGNNFMMFAAFFIPIYGVTIMTFGYWDMKKEEGLYKSEIITVWRRSPGMQIQMYLFSQLLWDNAEALKKIKLIITDGETIRKMNERIRELEG